MTSELLSSFFFTMLATAFVVALAYVLLRLLKRYQTRGALGGDNADANIEFVRSLALGTRERVTVVRFRGELMMLGVTAGGISLLARWEEGDLPPPAVADRDPPSVR